MRKALFVPTLAALIAALITATGFAITSRTAPEPPSTPLAHMVFFTLAEPSEENAEKLVKACETYLTKHKGTLHFSTGTRVEELDREVNNTEFGVALHLIFDSKASHDTYQSHPRHLKFIEENSSLWSGVEVFDSYLASPMAPPAPASIKPARTFDPSNN